MKLSVLFAAWPAAVDAAAVDVCFRCAFPVLDHRDRIACLFPRSSRQSVLHLIRNLRHQIRMQPPLARTHCHCPSCRSKVHQRGSGRQKKTPQIRDPAFLTGLRPQHPERSGTEGGNAIQHESTDVPCQGTSSQRDPNIFRAIFGKSQ
jgi:hypothetical protein